MGKCCLHACAFIFDRIIIKVAGNQDRHKSLDEFDFGPDPTTHFGVTCPWMTKILHFRFLRPDMTEKLLTGTLSLNTTNTFDFEYLWGKLANLDQILCVTSLGVGKGCIMFWGRLDQNSGAHGNRKPPLTYNGENGVSPPFLGCFWSDPFYTCR